MKMIFWCCQVATKLSQSVTVITVHAFRLQLIAITKGWPYLSYQYLKDTARCNISLSMDAC